MQVYLISDQCVGWWLVSMEGDVRFDEAPYVLQGLQAHLMRCRQDGCLPVPGYAFKACGLYWDYLGWLCKGAMQELCAVPWGEGCYRVEPGGAVILTPIVN